MRFLLPYPWHIHIAIISIQRSCCGRHSMWSWYGLGFRVKFWSFQARITFHANTISEQIIHCACNHTIAVLSCSLILNVAIFLETIHGLETETWSKIRTSNHKFRMVRPFMHVPIPFNPSFLIFFPHNWFSGSKTPTQFILFFFSKLYNMKQIHCFWI